MSEVYLSVLHLHIVSEGKSARKERRWKRAIALRSKAAFNGRGLCRVKILALSSYSAPLMELKQMSGCFPSESFKPISTSNLMCKHKIERLTLHASKAKFHQLRQENNKNLPFTSSNTERPCSPFPFGLLLSHCLFITLYFLHYDV